MTFDQIVTFVNVAKTKSFTKTAEALHLTQPSVTTRIKNLEEYLGTDLFFRENKTLELTRSGEKLLGYSNQILELFRQVQMDIGKISDEIVIGATPTLGIYILPRVIEELSAVDPKCSFVIQHGSSFDLLKMIIQGKIDIALVLNKIEHEDIILRELREPMRVVLVASPDHPIRNEHRITLETLKKYKLLKISNNGPFWKKINHLLQKHGISMDTFLQVDHAEIAKSILQNTVSMCFMPFPGVSKGLKYGSLIPIHIEGVPPFQFPSYLIYHRKLSDSLLIKKLMELLV